MVFIGFSTPRRWNPLSALIRAMTRSRTSHTWLLVEDPAFQLRLVLEAHSTGFRLVSFTRFVKDNKVVALVEPSHPVDPGLPAAGEWLGDSFDLLGLFGIFLTLVARWFRPAAGYPGSASLDDEGTSPADLLAVLDADPGCVVHRGADLKLWGHLGAVRRAAAAAPAPAAAAPPAAAA
jgi:hypothetical protein